jgi:hypothetical protein
LYEKYSGKTTSNGKGEKTGSVMRRLQVLQVHLNNRYENVWNGYVRGV